MVFNTTFNNKYRQYRQRLKPVTYNIYFFQQITECFRIITRALSNSCLLWEFAISTFCGSFGSFTFTIYDFSVRRINILCTCLIFKIITVFIITLFTRLYVKDWYFTHIWKTLAWQDYFTKSWGLGPWN